MEYQMKILVNGLGNIGTTLINLLYEFQKPLGITHIYALKNVIEPWKVEDLSFIEKLGVEVCTKGVSNYTPLKNIINDVDYIFDCTANGMGIKNKAWYEALPNLKGCSSQGSEKKFGKSFMTGMNNEMIKGCKFVYIVSCNTHGISSILKTLSGDDFNQIEESDFVVVRRSEDLGSHQKLVSANVVARHLSEDGTHHAIDALDLFNSIGLQVKITSSDITTPSQLMHSVRFNIKFKMPILKTKEPITSSSLVSKTHKFDSNTIFEIGRRYGFMGRLYSHAVIVENNLLLDEHSVRGWAFIPQEGNTLISTIHAYLLQTNNPDEASIIANIRSKLIINFL